MLRGLDCQGRFLIISPIIQEFPGPLATACKIISNAARLSFVLFHSCLPCNTARYSLDHLFQIKSEVYCDCLYLPLAYWSFGSNRPGRKSVASSKLEDGKV